MHCSRLSILILTVFFASSGPIADSHTTTFAKTPGVDADEASATAPSSPARGRIASQATYDLNLNVPRRNHTATVLADGRVLFIGGENENGSVSAVELLEPAWGAISQAGATINARSGHTATLLENGTVLVAGGSNASGALRSTEIYDPEKRSFSPGPILHRARAGHTATMLADGTVLLAGGDADRTAEIFDPRTGRFTLVASRTTVPRRFHSAIRLLGGNVLLVGGLGFYNGDTAEIFSVEDATFTSTTNWLQVNRVRPRLRNLPDGKIQIIGGDDTGSFELYDPVINRFRNHSRLSADDGMMPAAQVPRAATWTAILDGALSGDSRRPPAPLGAGATAGGKRALEKMARGDYSYSEIDSLGLGVIAGGIDRKGAFLQSVLLFASSPASVTSDRVEYPLETNEFVVATDPLISGSGWSPGEVVTITRQGAEHGTRIVLTAAADAAGNFSIRDHPTSSSGIDVYLLTASGQLSGYVAQSTYRIAASPDRATIEKYKGKKPTRIKARIPITGRSGTIQTDAGPLHWRVTPAKGVTLERASADSAVTPRVEKTVEAMATADMFEPLTVAPLADWEHDLFHFSTSWTEEPLPPAPLPNPLPDGLTITSTGSLTNGRGYIELDSKFEGPECHCCWCWPPCSCSLASASVSAAFVIEADVNVINDFSFEGEIQPFDPIPVWPIVLVEGDIPGTGGESPFHFQIDAGLYLGLTIDVTDPITVRTVFQAEDMRLRAGMAAGISLSIPIPKFGVWPVLEIEAAELHGNASLLNFGGIEIKPSLMAGFQAQIELGADLPIIDCKARIFAHAMAGPYLNLDIGPKDGLDPALCQKYDVALKAGLRAELGAGIGCGSWEESVGDDFYVGEFVIYDPDWAEFLFKDPAPPTITPSPNIVVPAEVGTCTVVVNVPPATATDVCTATSLTGVRSDLLFLTDPYPVGVTTITWTALDGGSPPNSATASQTVTVTDTTPPVLGAIVASAAAIWPPDHGMREIAISYDPTDECGPVTGSLSVTSNEPVNSTDDGNTEPDWEVVDAHTVRLRAERSGIGTGRVYTITVTVVDGSGNSSTGSVQVYVPLSQPR